MKLKKIMDYIVSNMEIFLQLLKIVSKIKYFFELFNYIFLSEQ